MTAPLTPVIYTEIPRIDPALIERVRAMRVADLHEGMGAVHGRQGLMAPAMRPLFPGARLCGQAITCYNYPGDNLMLHVAARLARPGDIIVATNGGGVQGALWGDMITYFARLRGIGGAVIDGAARDTGPIRDMGFPVFTTAISVSHPEKRSPGSANVPVSVAGAVVYPGDLIVGDDDGVLVMPPESIEPALARAEARAVFEEGLRAKLRDGATMFDLLGLEPVVEAAGIARVEGTWQQANAKV